VATEEEIEMSDIYHPLYDPDDDLPICGECLDPIRPGQETGGNEHGDICHWNCPCDTQSVDDIGERER
jgi:hypothetical protein